MPGLAFVMPEMVLLSTEIMPNTPLMLITSPATRPCAATVVNTAMAALVTPESVPTVAGAELYTKMPSPLMKGAAVPVFSMTLPVIVISVGNCVSTGSLYHCTFMPMPQVSWMTLLLIVRRWMPVSQ